MKSWNKKINTFLGWSVPSVVGLVSLWPSETKANINISNIDNLENQNGSTP